MAISEVGGHGTSGWGSAFADTHGLTIAAGDIIVATLSGASNSPVVVLTDNNGAYPFTSEGSETIQSNTARWHWWYRVAGASEPASYAFTSTYAVDWTMLVRVFRGVDAANIFDLAPSGVTSASGLSATATAATRTTNFANSLAVATYVNGSNVTYSGQTNGFASELESSTGWAGQASYTKAIPAAGAIGATAVTLSGSGNWNAKLYALRASAASDRTPLIQFGVC